MNDIMAHVIHPPNVPPGVLMHIFDGSEAVERPWLPCSTSHCTTHGDRISATVVNVRRPHLYPNGCSGVVISSEVADELVLCSYYSDGGSNKIACTPRRLVNKDPLVDDLGVWCPAAATLLVRSLTRYTWC